MPARPTVQAARSTTCSPPTGVPAGEKRPVQNGIALLDWIALVVFDVLIDLLGRLVEFGLHIATGHDVIDGFCERCCDHRIGRGFRTDQRDLLGGLLRLDFQRAALGEILVRIHRLEGSGYRTVDVGNTGDFSR